MKTSDKNPLIVPTILRLQRIRPCERVRYYSGQHNEFNHDNPLLMEIFAFAKALQKRGIVELIEESRTVVLKPCRVRDKGLKKGLLPEFEITDFFAVGR